MKGIHLDGTEFWVVIKPQPKYLKGGTYSQWFWCKKDVTELEAVKQRFNHCVWWEKVTPGECLTQFAPYAIGEELYVKEAWQSLGNKENTVYKMDGESKLTWDINGKHGEEIVTKWRSPALMPEWAARKFVIVTDVKAEQIEGVWKWHYTVKER